MALYHYNLLIKNFPEYVNKIYVLKNMEVGEEVTDASVADPIGMSEAFYEQIFQEIDGELERILPGLEARIEKYLR
jgi:protein-tyrosine-phosphatase